MSQSFPLDIFGRVWGQKLTGRTWAHRKVKIRTKAHPLFFFSISLISQFLLTTPGHPLIISSHTSIWVCISVEFNTTQDGSDCLSVSYSAPREMVEFVCLYQPNLHIRWPLSVIWKPYNVVVFASLSHIEHHTRGVCGGLTSSGPCLVGLCWKSVGWHSSNLNLHIKKSQLCSLFCSLCTSICTHHTNGHVNSADCSKSSNYP